MKAPLRPRLAGRSFFRISAIFSAEQKYREPGIDRIKKRERERERERESALLWRIPRKKLSAPAISKRTVGYF